VAVADGAETRAREDRVADEQEVALALLHLDRLDHLEPVRGEPVHEGRSSPRRSSTRKHAERATVDDEPAVGGVDHVGQSLDRVDELDLVAEREVGVVQRLPLRDGLGRVGGLGRLHPRVDAVAHREVLGCAHQVAAVLGDARRALTPVG
jgi:hypothetical protein